MCHRSLPGEEAGGLHHPIFPAKKSKMNLKSKRTADCICTLISLQKNIPRGDPSMALTSTIRASWQASRGSGRCRGHRGMPAVVGYISGSRTRGTSWLERGLTGEPGFGAGRPGPPRTRWIQGRQRGSWGLSSWIQPGEDVRGALVAGDFRWLLLMESSRRPQRASPLRGNRRRRRWSLSHSRGCGRRPGRQEVGIEVGRHYGAGWEEGGGEVSARRRGRGRCGRSGWG